MTDLQRHTLTIIRDYGPADAGDIMDTLGTSDEETRDAIQWLYRRGYIAGAGGLSWMATEKGRRV